jgi:hypothetical protein
MPFQDGANSAVTPTMSRAATASPTLFKNISMKTLALARASGGMGM